MDISTILSFLNLVQLGRKTFQRVKAFLRRFVAPRTELEAALLEARTAKVEREACRVELERLQKAHKEALAKFVPLVVGGMVFAFTTKPNPGNPREGRRLVCPRCLERGVVADLSREVRVRHVLGTKPKKGIYFACSNPACAYHFAASELALRQAFKFAD